MNVRLLALAAIDSAPVTVDPALADALGGDGAAVDDPEDVPAALVEEPGWVEDELDGLLEADDVLDELLCAVVALLSPPGDPDEHPLIAERTNNTATALETLIGFSLGKPPPYVAERRQILRDETVVGIRPRVG